MRRPNSEKLTSSVSWRFPDRLLSIQRLPFGEARMGFDGTTGWSTFGDQHHEDASIGNDVRSEYDRSLFHLLGHAEDVTLRATDAPSTIDGVAYRVGYATTHEGRSFTLYFAPDGALARIDYVGQGPSGQAEMTDVFADWKPVGAIRYPHARQVLLQGKPYLVSHLDLLTLGPTLEDALFKKPGP